MTILSRRLTQVVWFSQISVVDNRRGTLETGHMNDSSANDHPSDASPTEVGLENWGTFGDLIAPRAPEELTDMGVDPTRISELALKLAASTTQFTTDWASRNLCLTAGIVEEIYWGLKDEHEIEVLGQAGPLNYRYAITERGRERAKRLMTVSGYVGPAPVSLEAYSEHLLWQSERHPRVTMNAVREALQDMVLSDDAIEVAALAAASERSLFMFGPPGNGKTTIGKLLHRVYQDDMWIPYCMQVDSNSIRVFDPQIHERLPVDDPHQEIDHRWVRIRRPFVIAGGEMTIEELDLAWSDSLHFYEAPPHVKANGGTFMIDDFGRQRMAPSDLLNRWIVPLENRVDYLTLHTGQKIQIPFELMLTVATNLTVEDVADPAFLRRMGYRLHVHPPTPEQYKDVFERFAQGRTMAISDGVVNYILARYDQESRDLRCSEAGELIDRCADICKLHDLPREITTQITDMAWKAYFGNQ